MARSAAIGAAIEPKITARIECPPATANEPQARAPSTQKTTSQPAARNVPTASRAMASTPQPRRMNCSTFSVRLRAEPGRVHDGTGHDQADQQPAQAGPAQRQHDRRREATDQGGDPGGRAAGVLGTLPTGRDESRRGRRQRAEPGALAVRRCRDRLGRGDGLGRGCLGGRGVGRRRGGRGLGPADAGGGFPGWGWTSFPPGSAGICCGTTGWGRVIRTRQPIPAGGSTIAMVPWCSSTAQRAMARPRPVPPSLRAVWAARWGPRRPVSGVVGSAPGRETLVVKRSKTRSRWAGAIPLP